MVCVSTLCLGGCAVSPSTGNATLHGDDDGVRRDAQSQQSGRDDYDDTRAAELPLAPKTIADVPFDVWSPKGSIPGDLVIGGQIARRGRKRVGSSTSGVNPGKTDAQVLTLIDGGVAFGTGTSPQVSPRNRWLDRDRGQVHCAARCSQCGRRIYPVWRRSISSLNATGASSWGQVVVWLPWVQVGSNGLSSGGTLKRGRFLSWQQRSL